MSFGAMGGFAANDSRFGRIANYHWEVDSTFYPPWDGKMSSNSFI